MQPDITDPSVVFGHVLVQEYLHWDQFHFDLRQYEFEKVKSVLEANGFKVDEDPGDISCIAVSKPHSAAAQTYGTYEYTPENQYHMTS